MKFFDLPNEPAKRKQRAKTSTVALEREEVPFELFTDDELTAAKGGILVYDTECYPTYWLIAFKCYFTNKIVYFERTADKVLEYHKLLFVLHNFTICGFNSISYDMPLTWFALNGATTETLKNVTDFIIRENWRPSDVEKAFKFKMGSINHLDLIEVAPLSASLKKYMGRMHSKRLQDLPYNPDQTLSPEEMLNVRNYCINDLEGTLDLLKELSPQLELRSVLSHDYNQDLRSKSDAQIAEAVICSEVKMSNGYWAKRPTIEPGTVYKYNVPCYVKFQTPLLQNMLEVVRNANFVIHENGSVIEPPEFSTLKSLKVGHSSYRMGIGGLHSTEECASHIADETTILCDVDATSFYPQIILNQKLYPKQLTENFLRVYESIVTRRIKAKKSGDKVTADSLKITINGSFGKFGSKYSSLYSPDLMFQTTVSGQLNLLMLIEMIELSGIPVVSGNTDGIIIKCPVDRYEHLNILIAEWERVTNFQTEETRYSAVYSKDVNNYLAVKLDGKCKAKGCYSTPGLQKNPTSLICVDAVIALLVGNISIEKTIQDCKDITKFVTVREVRGAGEKDGVYLGKVVRWIYTKGTTGTINYVATGNKVPKSDGAFPLMDLPKSFPNNIDYDRYVEETKSILYDINYYKREVQQKFF